MWVVCNDEGQRWKRMRCGSKAIIAVKVFKILVSNFSLKFQNNNFFLLLCKWISDEKEEMLLVAR